MKLIHLQNNAGQSTNMNNEKEKVIAIGDLIKCKITESGLSIEEFSKLICCNRGNVYKIFSRKRIDVELLLSISKVLKFDFFQLYSKQLRIEKEITTDYAQLYIEINLPVEEIEKEKICKYCKVNKLN